MIEAGCTGNPSATFSRSSNITLNRTAGAEFEVVEARLEDQMAEQYAAAASMWNQLRREFLYAAEQAGVAEKDAGLPKKRGSLLWRSFWASHQRFFRHMCMAAKVRFL